MLQNREDVLKKIHISETGGGRMMHFFQFSRVQSVVTIIYQYLLILTKNNTNPRDLFETLHIKMVTRQRES